ncbi:hypothetical protein TSTA_023500 [Talaromyces stipitatus ATCC 10500]|uniref:RING-type domain-containing protein n=1 Tax=Talaromyces stipitatus (strain ATCC 10500 / CBS 375.48 / QM 6759 / NRRL 1006) TaxID=441959 RepID=B8M615_TALSN|nr:uncharacterized protein TSTA_023500 [Talaromyces stipitatus ATCC 10500]EED19015.1 hypothetical protein TSTA_023500 [Talaromyces stipitatus ATCC 10500]
METQQQPALVQTDDWRIPGLIDEAEEELAPEGPTQVLHDSPPSTISFDEDSPPRQPHSERLSPSEEVEEAAGCPSPVIEISDDEDDNHPRPRLRNTDRPDYTYRDYLNIMEYAISAPPRRKWKGEDSDAVDFQSKVNQLVMEIQGPYEALEKENKRLKQERHQWMKDKKQLQLQIQYLRRQIDEQKQRNILKCILCHRIFNESWRVLGCGHTLCKNCVEDIKSKDSLFEYPCPYAQCKKPIQSCLDFYPNVVEA